MIGHSIKFEAGPSIIISFMIAAFSIFLSGYCFCELASRVSSNGAAYSYMYLAFGEIMAFFMGWLYVLQFIVGKCLFFISYDRIKRLYNFSYYIAISSDARALSGCIDSLLNNMISNISRAYIGRIDINGFSDHPDLLAILIILLNAGNLESILNYKNF